MDFDAQVDTCSLIYLALQLLVSRTTGLFFMDEGRTPEHVVSLNLLLPLDSQNIHSCPVIQAIWALINQRLDPTTKVSWSCESDDGLKVNYAFDNDDGLRVTWTL